jgi:hypothetical protein
MYKKPFISINNNKIIKIQMYFLLGCLKWQHRQQGE